MSHGFSLAVHADGKVLLGGGFTTLQPNGATAPIDRRYIARVTADGTFDTGFDPNPDGYIDSLSMQGDGKVLLAGYFTTLWPNGAITPTARQHLARLLNAAAAQTLTVPDATRVL